MEQQPTTSKLSLAVLTGLSAWGYTQAGPIIMYGEYQWLPITLAGVSALGALRLVGETVNAIATGLDWLAAHKPTGKSGTAKWAKYKDYKKVLSKKDIGPFWGLSLDNKKLFVPLDSNAIVIGPSGSGKGHTVVVPLIFLINNHSKIIMDFKPELLAITKKGLENMGQTVIKLDPFGAHRSLTGPTYQLNFLDIITDNLFREGGLKSVFTYAAEFANQLYPDPPNQQGDSKFWNNGSRSIISLICIAECMMNSYQGTMENVALLLSDPSTIELRLCSIVGQNLDGSIDEQGPFLFEMSEWVDHHSDDDVTGFLNSFRAKARGLLKQLRESEKQFSSFLEGALQAVEPFGFGELSSAMGPTNFDVDSLKNGTDIVNLFIVGDASRQKRTEQFFGATSWFIQTKMKSHANKHVPVYFINDEINNYSIFGFTDLLSYGRGFSLITINFLQNFTAFGKKHGKDAIDVLLSESPIKLVLPGQTSPDTLSKVVGMLGEQSVMTSSLTMGQGKESMRESTSESARKLMTEEELARSPHGILFIRGLLPILQQPISYSEISPLRKLASTNPFHPKPFLRKVKLKLKLSTKRKK